MTNNDWKTNYKSQTWLNDYDSPFTGNIICYDGINTNDNHFGFITINDCYHSAKIHNDIDKPYQEYINKIDLIIEELLKYRNHLKQYESIKSEDNYIQIFRNKDSIKIVTPQFKDYISLQEFFQLKDETLFKEFYNFRLKNLSYIEKEKIIKYIQIAIEKWK